MNEMTSSNGSDMSNPELRNGGIGFCNMVEREVENLIEVIRKGDFPSSRKLSTLSSWIKTANQLQCSEGYFHIHYIKSLFNYNMVEWAEAVKRSFRNPSLNGFYYF